MAPKAARQYAQTVRSVSFGGNGFRFDHCARTKVLWRKRCVSQWKSQIGPLQKNGASGSADLGLAGDKSRGATLALSNVRRAHRLRECFVSRLRAEITLGSGDVEPFVGFNARFRCIRGRRAKTAALMDIAEVKLRAGISLICGFLKPLKCLCVVFLHALAQRAHHAQIKLSERMILRSRQRKPMRRLRIIVGFEVRIIDSHAELSIGIARVGAGLGSFKIGRNRIGV